MSGSANRRARIACSLAALALLSAWLALPVPADMAGGFGPSAAAGGVSSGTAALEPDNAVVSSSTLLETTAWDTVALMPRFSSALEYDASEGTEPDSQGWTMSGTSADAVAGGIYTVTLSAGTGRVATITTVVMPAIARVDGARLAGTGQPNFRAGDDRAADTDTDRGISLTDASLAQLQDAAGPRAPAADFTVAGVLEWRYANNVSVPPNGVVDLFFNGARMMTRTSASDLDPSVVRFSSVPGNLVAGDLCALTRVRFASGVVYPTSSPTADVVIDLGAGNTGTWDMSTILSDEREGAGALRYRYEAGAADPGAADPLNGSDLSLTAIRTEGDPAGRFLRFRVVFPSDGTVLQPRAWGGGSIAWTIP